MTTFSARTSRSGYIFWNWYNCFRRIYVLFVERLETSLFLFIFQNFENMNLAGPIFYQRIFWFERISISLDPKANQRVYTASSHGRVQAGWNVSAHWVSIWQSSDTDFKRYMAITHRSVSVSFPTRWDLSVRECQTLNFVHFSISKIDEVENIEQVSGGPRTAPVDPTTTSPETTWAICTRRAGKLYRARSRLYRSRSLQVYTHMKALAEIYTIHSFAPFSMLKIFVKNRWKFC